MSMPFKTMPAHLKTGARPGGGDRRRVTELPTARRRPAWFVAVAAAVLTLTTATAQLTHESSLRSSTFRPDSEQLQLLEELEVTAVRFFIDHTDPVTGLTRDRAPNRAVPANAPASIAATGFALTAWCIADARGWLPAGEALQRVRTTLRFAHDELEHVHGWFYHFVDPHTGIHARDSEVSTIDTALFLQGAVMAREYLKDREVTQLVDRIYRRIDWRWAQNGRLSLTMGWKPETGFIEYRWDSYCELMGMYLLGLGAPDRALSPAAWDVWRRPKATVAGRTYIHCGPLFTHQYSHAWFDFRSVRDSYADYWQNSVEATLAQRAWSAEQQHRYPRWSTTLWGLTASDGPNGYMAWGTPVGNDDVSDGTLVPCAPGGSLPFAPAECLSALQQMRAIGGDRVWGPYGFADAFNPHTGWVSPDVIGIDVGITLLMAENLRTGFVWEHFMRAPEVIRGMRVAGFQPYPPASLLTVAEPSPASPPASDSEPMPRTTAAVAPNTRRRAS